MQDIELRVMRANRETKVSGGEQIAKTIERSKKLFQLSPSYRKFQKTPKKLSCISSRLLKLAKKTGTS